MGKKPAPDHFSRVLDDEPRPQTAPAKQKPKQLNFLLDPDLKKRLDRAVYHKGRSSTQLLYLTKIITEALDADPHANVPIPGETE